MQNPYPTRINDVRPEGHSSLSVIPPLVAFSGLPDSDNPFREFEQAARQIGVAFSEVSDSVIDSVMILAMEWTDDIEGDFIPLDSKDFLNHCENEYHAASRSNDQSGFTFIKGDTWLPTPLYKERGKQQRCMARKNETGIVWTRRNMVLRSKHKAKKAQKIRGFALKNGEIGGKG